MVFKTLVGCHTWLGSLKLLCIIKHINRDVKSVHTGNIFIDSNAVTKLADFRIFQHLCLKLGICNTPEILLLELLAGASLKTMVVDGISILYSHKVTRHSLQ